MLLVYGPLLVIGSVLAAAAADPAMFIAGHVLQGLCTSLLLIAAAPPLFLGYPAARLRWSAMIMNMCLFGAVTAGPLIGGVQASFHAWRPLFWIVAGIAAAGLAMSLLTFQDAPPADRAAPRDPAALGLAAAGSVAAFWGASELITHRFLDPVAVVPLLALRSLASTIPVTGVVVAICAAAASTSAVGLTAAVLAPRYAPLHLGLLFAPELAGAVITSIVLFEVFTTRGIHYFVLAGMIFLTAGVLMLREVIPPSSALTLAGSGLNGVGIGAWVTPALFLAAFSLRSAGLQRVFAVLELLRAVAAFLVAPVLLHFAVTLAGLPTAAMGTALWICFAVSAGGALAGVALYLLGGVRPSAPKVQPWRDHVGSAWPSPPLLAAVRPGPARRAMGEESARRSTGRPPSPSPRSPARPRGVRLRRLRAGQGRDRRSRPPAACPPRRAGGDRLEHAQRRVRPRARDALRLCVRRRGQTGCRADCRTRGRTRQGGRVPRAGHRGRGHAHLEGHCRYRRQLRREPHRPRLPWPSRAERPSGRQRGPRRRGPLAQARADRARTPRSIHLRAGKTAASRPRPSAMNYWPTS